MENDKASNPSSGANADDLIEEMARLMSQDADKPTENSAKSDRAAPANPPAPGQPSNSPAENAGWMPRAIQPAEEPSAPVSVPRAAKETPAPPRAEPAPIAPPARAPEPKPASIASKTPAPTSAVPAFELPGILRPTNPDPAPETPRRSERFASPAAPSSPMPKAPEPKAPTEPAQGRAFDFNFDLDKRDQKQQGGSSGQPSPNPPAPALELPAALRTEPEAPAAIRSAPEVKSAPSPASAATPEPEEDLIAELIGQNLPGSATSQSPAQDTGSASHVAPPAPSTPTNTPTRAPAPTDGPQDSFSVAPVFGLGGSAPTSRETPAHADASPARTKTGSDALDDIENLIGKAVRIESDDMDARGAVEGGAKIAAASRPAPNQAAPTQAAPTQAAATPTPQTPAAAQPHQADPQPMPQVSPAQDISNNVSAAEAAIRSAMGDTPQSGQQNAAGAFIESADDEPTLAEGRAMPARTPVWRRVIVPAAALLLLGVIGYSGWSLLNQPGNPDDAPLIVASNDPIKEEPVASQDTGSAESLVLDGISDTPATDEQLVSRDQSTDADDPIRQIISSDGAEGELANRKVRTVTVRPDGTIIQGEDQVAGTEALGVDRPNLPDLPEEIANNALAQTALTPLVETANDIADAVVAATQTEPAPATNIVTVNNNSVPFPVRLLANREQLAAQLVQTAAATPLVSAPAAAPTATPANGGAVDLISPAATNAPAQTQAPQASTSANVGAWVQMASQRSQATADQTAANMQRQFANILNGQQLQVQRADLGDRGVFFRVVLPANNLTEATAICTQIQNAGGNCFPRNN